MEGSVNTRLSSLIHDTIVADAEAAGIPLYMDTTGSVRGFINVLDLIAKHKSSSTNLVCSNQVTGKIMLVGLCPPESTEPFVGGPRKTILTQLLNAAQLKISKELWNPNKLAMASAVYYENSDQMQESLEALKKEIISRKPEVVICFGEYILGDLVHPNFSKSERGILFNSAQGYHIMVVPGFKEIQHAIISHNKEEEKRIKNVMWNGIKRVSSFLSERLIP